MRTCREAASRREHPDLRDAFIEPGQDPRSFRDHPGTADDVNEALYERHAGPRHQVGGYAHPVQGPVEYEVAQAALDGAETFRAARPAIMVAMPTAEIYTLLLAGLLIGGVLWVVTRFIDRD